MELRAGVANWVARAAAGMARAAAGVARAAVGGGAAPPRIRQRRLQWQPRRGCGDVYRIDRCRAEEGLQAASKVQQETDQLKSQLLRERSDLLKLSDSYGRAKENLVRAETKLSQAEKLASLGQLIVGVSADLGAKASEVNQSIADLSKSLDRFVEDYVPASEELSSSEHVVTDLRRLFVFVEKGAGSILRMNQALNHYSAGESQPMATEILSDVFEDVRLIVHGRIRQHRLEVNIPDNLRLMCRRSQVERVLGNLLTNASDGITYAGSSTDDKDLINTKATSKQGDFVVLASLDGTTAWQVTQVRGTFAKES